MPFLILSSFLGFLLRSTYTPITHLISFSISHRHQDFDIDFITPYTTLPLSHRYTHFVTHFHSADFFPFPDGFFDAGLLNQALKANRGEAEHPAERDVIRRNIGRRLRLAEY
jgi:hypothetical protein